MVVMIRRGVFEGWAAELGMCVDYDLDALHKLGVYRGDGSKGSGYTLIKSSVKNPLPILGVCHLDYVTAGAVPLVSHGRRVVSCALDDRLGLWCLLYGLPRALGGGRVGCQVPYDILLTEDEELGASTASAFGNDNGVAGYRWLFMFDRAGADCAYYGYDSVKWLAALRGQGWDCERGSYSCIADLEKRGQSGVNFGVGYIGQHTAGCYADCGTVLWQVRRVAEFVRQYGRVNFPHTASRGVDYRGGWYGGDYSLARERVVAQSKIKGADYWDAEFDRHKWDEVDLWDDDNKGVVDYDLPKRSRQWYLNGWDKQGG